MLATMQSAVILHPHHMAASSTRAPRQAKSSKPASTSGSAKRNSARPSAISSSSSPKPSELSKTSFSVSSSSTPGLLTLSRPDDDGSAHKEDRKHKHNARSQKKVFRTVAICEAASGEDSDYRASDEVIFAVDEKSKRISRANVSKNMTLTPEAELSKFASASSMRAATKDSAEKPTGDSDWGMPLTAFSRSREVLNWQQQMTASSKPKKAKKQSQPPAQLIRKSSSPSEALTWQQELFSPLSSARRGPHFDVFADAKDVETFGDVSAASARSPAGSVGEQISQRSFRAIKAKKGVSTAALANTAGDLSIDEIFSGPRDRPRSAAQSSSGPATPARRALGQAAQRNSSSPSLNAASVPAVGTTSSSLEAAYAGPDFHNSPSAASLPAPKFGNRQAKASVGNSLQRKGSHNSGSSSSSSGGGEDGDMSMLGRRDVCAATDPPGIVSANSSSRPENPGNAFPENAVTIENLLAKLMGGGAV